ncbi:MAG: aminopeptidase P family protein [Alphaproteobacteria bacterium]|nr:aminopeptidase P family protein [Alphaproteobacteria bacterium]
MLENIREKMQKFGLDAYVISYSNRFLGQDVLMCEHKLNAVCGFSGSAGALAVTKDKAFLVIDGRYELQAQKQVDMSKVIIINDSPRLKTLCDVLKKENVLKIGYDAWNHSIAEMDFIRRKYADFEFYDVGDFVGLTNNKEIDIFERGEEFSGMAKEEKIGFIVEQLQQKKADYALITSADSVSWLLNIYSDDLPCSPVVRAYALIDKNGVFKLFGENLKSNLSVKNWQEFSSFLQNSGAEKIICDPHTTPEKIKHLLNPEAVLIKNEDIIQDLKAQKNATELQGMINCHIRDGVALCKFLCWLEENFVGKTELDVVEKLHEFRARQNLFFSESFETIAGFAENGAIVHYQPKKETNKELMKGNLLLLDSGGQYLDGTTDVTRTVALGEPTEKMKRDFTLVLKAHIALAKAKFPLGTSGYKLDALARAPLWEHELDYKHGTGHGVACFGNVHEGPLSISVYGSMYGLKENMVTSIEPGIYKENKYGIRIENLVYTEKCADNPEFLRFEPLTMVPIDKKLIDSAILNKDEIKWLNDYHQMVFEKIEPYLDENERQWLKNACSAL